MRGDIIRITFPGKHHVAVRMQQGRVPLDDDWAEDAGSAASGGARWLRALSAAALAGLALVLARRSLPTPELEGG